MVVANTQRLLVVGANASPVRWFFPPASRFHYQVAGCMFSPHVSSTRAIALFNERPSLFWQTVTSVLLGVKYGNRDHCVPHAS